MRLSRSAGSRCLPSCQALTSLGQIRMRATGLSARCFFFGRAIPIRMAQDNCGRPSSVATARASGTLFAGKHRFFRPRVRRRCHIALIAILALAFHHSVGPCGANVSSCEASVCPAHQHGGCHQHSKNSVPQTSHECCLSAICLNAADKPDSAAGPVQQVLPMGLTPRPVEVAQPATRLTAFARNHAPPPSVAIFLSIHTFVI